MLAVSATATGIENTVVVTYRFAATGAAAGMFVTVGGVRLIKNTPRYTVQGYKAVAEGLQGGYMGVKAGFANAVAGVRTAGGAVASVFTTDYARGARRARDNVIAIKDVGSSGTLRRGRAMGIFTLAASSLLHLGRVGPLRCFYEGTRLVIVVAGQAPRCSALRQSHCRMLPGRAWLG